MTAEAPDAKLRRAADYLSAADGKCSMGFDATGVLPADLMLYRVARAVAAPLAAWLRRTVTLAEISHDGMVPGARETALNEWLRVHHGPALQIARAVLGETDGGEPRG